MGKHSGHVTRGQRWAALRAQVLARDRHACQLCGKRGRLEIDHKAPVRTHPRLAWDMGNLQALCPSCHSKKTNRELGRIEASPARDAWRAAVRALERTAPRAHERNPRA